MSASPAEAIGDGLDRRPAAWLLLVWVAAAALATLCGIGGGLFAVPVLHYLGGMRLQRAVGTALVLVLVLAVTATATEALRADSALDLRVAGLLIAGSVVGARLGFEVALRIRTRLLKLCFAVVLSVVAVRIFTMSSEVAGVAGVFEPTLGAASLVLGIGFCGGFVAPLLGIGGGLVVVPALFLLGPGCGYLEARANSLAMGIVAAAVSARMHLRAGNVHLPSAAWFAVSTVVGAVIGVSSVHAEGWVGVARIALGVVLLCSAARFTWDLIGRQGRGES